MKKIKLYFKEIDCIACSKKVEEALNKDKLLSNVSINFINGTIDLEYDESITDLLSYIEKIGKKKEPEMEVSFDPFNEDNEIEVQHYSKNKKEHHHISITKDMVIFFIGLSIFLITFILSKIIQFNNVLLLVLYLISYLVLSYKILIKSFKNILNGNIFDENILMIIASIGAFLIKEYPEAIMVVLLYNIGEYLQDKAVDSSIDKINSLTSLKVDEVTLENGTIVKTKDVNINDIIIVNAGERIPLDGIVLEGSSSIDTKAITGESLPQDININDIVLSGSINISNTLKIKVTTDLANSTSSKIISLVEEASSKKSKAENFITKFSKIYTPVVIILAVVVFLVEYLTKIFTLKEALNNSLVFLVSACPCALIISIPLAFFSGIGNCSSFGLFVKGGNHLENLSKTKQVCFDKTGTLTYGNFIIKEITANDCDEDYLIDMLCSIEKYSNHPISKAICSFKDNGTLYDVTDVKEVRGKGLMGLLNGKVILAGKGALLEDYHIEYEEEECPGTVVYLAYDNKFLGNVLLKDEIKKESKLLINKLHNLNVTTCILSGDRISIVDDVKNELHIDQAYGELLPDEKLNLLNSMLDTKDKNTSVVYIGDGINDTPSLKLADVGIAIGGKSSDEAKETADIVLLGNDLRSIYQGIMISKKTMNVLKENIILALVIKLIALVIGSIGLLGSKGMLLGVFADVGVCLLTILNTVRILKYKGEK